MTKLAKKPLRRFFDETGYSDIRVTGKAMIKFRDDVESYADALARASVKVAKQNKRKTVRYEDIELVQDIFTIFVLIQENVIPDIQKSIKEWVDEHRKNY